MSVNEQQALGATYAHLVRKSRPKTISYGSMYANFKNRQKLIMLFRDAFNVDKTVKK